MNFNRETFFDGYRGIAGSLSQSQVDGIEFLLDKIENDPEWENIAQIAYVLSTTEHETASTFQPIKEYRAKVGTKARARQDKYWMTGYMGRGYVQLTHKENYEHYGIADEPSRAMEPEKAYEILSDGMRSGAFTGHKLGTYVSKSRKDYFNARKVVNGLDKAQKIADRARAFESILLESAQLHEQEAEEPTRHHAAKPVVHASPDQPAKAAQMDEKGVTTSPDTSKAESEGTPPPAPAMEIKASRPSLKSVAASVVTFLLAPLSWIGIDVEQVKSHGVEFAKGNLGLAIKLAFAFALIVLAVWVWNRAMDRANSRTLKVMDAAKDQDANNLRLV